MRRQLTDDITWGSVDSEEQSSRHAYAKNTCLVIDDEELEAFKIDSSQTIEADNFVSRARTGEHFFESPYYSFPDDEVGQEAFSVIREGQTRSSSLPPDLRRTEITNGWVAIRSKRRSVVGRAQLLSLLLCSHGLSLHCHSVLHSRGPDPAQRVYGGCSTISPSLQISLSRCRSPESPWATRSFRPLGSLLAPL